VSPSSQGLDRGHLLTEQANPASEGLDQLPTADLVQLFCENDLEPQRAVAGAAPALTAAVDAIAARLAQGGRLFYLGAGTSGRLGVLDAAECPPTFCSPPELVQGVLAGGAAALLRSSEGLEDRFDAGPADLKERGFGPADALVGIAAGGTTPYVLGGLSYAVEIGALAIGLRSATSLANHGARYGYTPGLSKVGPNGMVAIYTGAGAAESGGKERRLWIVVPAGRLLG